MVTNYAICFLQVMNQFALTLTVPLYFQATNRSSPAAAGAYLIPAFLGNMTGGLIAGYWIKRTGLYKLPTVLAPLCALLAMSLCYFTWQGNTTVAESLAIFPGGFAAGLVSSSCFVGLAAGVTEQDMAVASSGIYLSFNVGAIAGTSTSSAVYQTSLRAGLKRALEGVENGNEVRRQRVRHHRPDADLEFTRSWSVLSRASLTLRMRAIECESSLFRLLCTVSIKSIVSQENVLKKPVAIGMLTFAASDVYCMCSGMFGDCCFHSREET